MKTQTSIAAFTLGAVLALGALSPAPAQAGAAHITAQASQSLPLEQVGFRKFGHRKTFRKRRAGRFGLRLGRRHFGRGHFHRGFGRHYHGRKGFVHGHRHRGGKLLFRPQVRIVID
ncbi:MAG: hypothetical protein AAGH68_00725 [Pseudomonadota bacterium]